LSGAGAVRADRRVWDRLAAAQPPLHGFAAAPLAHGRGLLGVPLPGAAGDAHRRALGAVCASHAWRAARCGRAHLPARAGGTGAYRRARAAHDRQAAARPGRLIRKLRFAVMANPFADLGLSQLTLDALRDVGYESPSPIQEQAIPTLLEGRDVIGQAQTGTGKTAAFGLPIMEYVDPSEPTVQALVLTPTRELCIQVTQALRIYGSHSGVDVVAVFGGAPIRTQQAQLRGGGHVVVGTVGRVLDLISRHSLMLHDCRFVVLDEADEMLDLGFLEDVEKILSRTPPARQPALSRGTRPPPTPQLRTHYMSAPIVTRVGAATLTTAPAAHSQPPVDARRKPETLVDVLNAEAGGDPGGDGNRG